MSDVTLTHESAALADARQTIAELRAEVARLKLRVTDERFAQELRETFTLATFAGSIATPFGSSSLLQSIVEAASYFLSAQAASLFVVDEQARELAVAVALGPKAAEVQRLRIPLGHGFAGIVAESGQPMAVTDVGRDPRHAADISQLLNHVPHSLLCVPLLSNGRVIGVLELLDKEDAPGFGTDDIDALGLFADQAAVAIEQARTLRHLAALVAEVLALLGDSPDQRRLRESVQEYAQQVEEDPTFRRALDLARLVQQIARHGDQELDACRAILDGFAAYLRSRPRPVGGAR